MEDTDRGSRKHNEGLLDPKWRLGNVRMLLLFFLAFFHIFPVLYCFPSFYCHLNATDSFSLNVLTLTLRVVHSQTIHEPTLIHEKITRMHPHDIIKTQCSFSAPGSSFHGNTTSMYRAALLLPASLHGFTAYLSHLQSKTNVLIPPASLLSSPTPHCVCGYLHMENSPVSLLSVRGRVLKQRF
ncbi:hypothetical protein AMECASPLE_028062, partial [Ameca splendens]